MDPIIRSEETIFLEAIEKVGAEREAYLSQACGEDEKLRQRVRALISSHEVAPTYLGIGNLSSPGPAPAGEQASDRIGRYKLLQEIGSGGFGTVWMAEQQEPVRRRVALKIIKLGMDTREVVARFEAERQALAMMSHPSIAQVFDAGATDSGRPYFVMELVRGSAITKFCDEQKLPMRERLSLFVQVCHAIQHAHQKGIIHRDIKPSNILITAGDDGRPLPKVIDFGIAKAMDSALTERTLFTQFEQMIGTPAYMSPEQTGAGPMDIDTRSDVYALGVLLYEMLTGRPPFDAKSLVQAGFEAMRRVIREDEPPKPSTCLSSMQQAQLTNVAESRHTDVPKLVTAVKGDLDWIVMKALEKNRSRRYETASAFATDIERHLRDEAVTARPPSRAYLAGKTLRRHRYFFIACGAVLLALVAGIIVSAWQALRARRAEQQEKTERILADDARLRAERTSYVMSMGMAQMAWEGGDLRLMHDALHATKTSSHRGFEWFYWWGRSRLDRRTIYGPVEGVESIAVSADGTRIVTGGLDGNANVWEAATGRKVFSLPVPQGESRTVAISPDGRYIVTCGLGDTGRIWDATTGRELHLLRGLGSSPTFPANAVFSPDSQQLLTRGQGSTAIVWEVASGRPILFLPNRQSAVSTPVSSALSDFVVGDGHKRALSKIGGAEGTLITAVAYSSDARSITGRADGTVTVWDAQTAAERVTFRAHADRVSSIAYSESTRRIATASADRTIRLWNGDTGSEVLSIRTSDPVKSIAFSPSGRELVAGVRSVARVWDTNSGQELYALKGHLAGVTSVLFIADGKTIATGSSDATVKLWEANPARYREGLSVNRFGPGRPALAFSSDSQFVITATPLGKLQRWDLETGRELPIPSQAGSVPASSKAISVNGKHVITSAGAMVEILDSQTGKRLRRIDLPFSPLLVAVSPNGARVVAASGGKGGLWNAADGQQIRAVPVSAAARAIAFSSGGERFVVADFARATVYNAETGATEGAAQVSSSLAAVSPDGSRILTEEGTDIRFSDGATGQEILKLKGHAGEVTSAGFSPDGKRIVTGSMDGTAKVWDLRTGFPLLTLKGHEGGMATVLFSPDNRRVLTIGLDGTLKVWSASSEAALQPALASPPQK